MSNLLLKDLSKLLNFTVDYESTGEVSLRLGDLIVLQAALFVAICSTILTYLFMQIIASRLTGTIEEPTLLISDLLSYISSVQPLYFTANQIFQMLLFSLIITVGGKLFNGKGKFFEEMVREWMFLRFDG